MNRQRTHRTSSRVSRKRQGGIALVTAVLLLLLISGTIVSTIEFSGGEYQAGGRARATSRNLYAADSGVQLGFIRVAAPRDLSPFTFTLSDGTTVESRARSDASAQPIAAAGIGQPPDGYAINVGTGYVNELFDLNVTASSPAGSVSELESKLALLQPNSGGY
jgi:hypothetical protein